MAHRPSSVQLHAVMVPAALPAPEHWQLLRMRQAPSFQPTLPSQLARLQCRPLLPGQLSLPAQPAAHAPSAGSRHAASEDFHIYALDWSRDSQ